jgi:hypothetical protein
MNRERFERLVKYFEEEFPAEWVAKGKFDLGKWMASTGATMSLDDAFTKITTNEDHLVLEPKFCQTHGCIMGWATTIPEFKKEGLHLSTCNPYSVIVTISFEGKEDFFAAASFFNITVRDAEYLFSPESYDTDEELHDPKYAIARIKEVLINGFPETYDQEEW